jgi:4-diphosphocytidyl-2C-methyl-D-erythritol kinase
VKQVSANDFEAVLLDREPQLRELFARLERTQPLLARLCGSGSAVFAVYESEGQRNAAYAALTDLDGVISTNVRAEAAPQPTATDSM